MACEFSEVYNGCGCLIGYNIPLQTDGSVDINSYPVIVENVNGDQLDQANTPSEYAAIWNADTDDAALGTLYVGTGAYCFYLRRNPRVTIPVHVLGIAALLNDDGSPLQNDDGGNLLT